MHSLLHSKTLPSFFITLILLISNSVLAFMFTTTQSFRMNPIHPIEFLENLKKVVEESDFPALDVFICTADPDKEPPMNVVNMALSVMAYDYLTDKNKIVECNPEAYFAMDHSRFAEAEKIKNVIERGKVGHERITGEGESQAFRKWTDEFTRQDHPTVIQILLDNSKDKDITEHSMPNLIYVSGEKRGTSPHHFKTGALNALLRVSATMTNAPTILTLDCDTYSNDPQTPHRALQGRNRAAFYGNAPMNLVDVLNQNKRWSIGDLEVAFSKHSTITHGTRAMGPFMGLAYAHYAFWPIWSIPITTYAFLPQLALLNEFTIFPMVSNPWFLLYVYLCIGTYGQDLLDFVLVGGTFHSGGMTKGCG
ncbi:unnamed protein product [Prunus armeniaca]